MKRRTRTDEHWRMDLVAIVWWAALIILSIAGLFLLAQDGAPEIVVVGLGLFLLFGAQPVWEHVRARERP